MGVDTEEIRSLIDKNKRVLTDASMPEAFTTDDVLKEVKAKEEKEKLEERNKAPDKIDLPENKGKKVEVELQKIKKF